MTAFFLDTKYTEKGADTVAVFRVERTRDNTVMSNHHLKIKDLS